MNRADSPKSRSSMPSARPQIGHAHQRPLSAARDRQADPLWLAEEIRASGREYTAPSPGTGPLVPGHLLGELSGGLSIGAVLASLVVSEKSGQMSLLANVRDN